MSRPLEQQRQVAQTCRCGAYRVITINDDVPRITEFICGRCARPMHLTPDERHGPRVDPEQAPEPEWKKQLADMGR